MADTQKLLGDGDGTPPRRRYTSVRVEDEIRARADRQKPTSVPITEEWNNIVNFDGKMFLSRLKKDPDFICIALEVLGIIVALIALYFCYFHFDHFHYHVSHVYANLGHPHAQHLVGDRLLHGKGVDQDKNLAMEWFRKAADQGHPHSSYNLAIGHLNGLRTDVQPGEVNQLIKHAADNGVIHAKDVYEHVCKQGRCD